MQPFRELKGIASGLLGTFVSRNNDISGYWGIGLLCRDALASNGAVELRLLEGHATPSTASTASALLLYLPKLKTMIEKRRFSMPHLAEATISVQFGTPGHFPMPPQFTRGDPFLCTVTLTDIRGKRHSVSAVSRCAPHNPRFESRSVRVDAV